MMKEIEGFIFILIKDYPEQAKGQVLYGRIRTGDLLETGEGEDYVRINVNGEIRELSKGTIWYEHQREGIKLGCEPDSYLERLSNDISDYKGRYIMRVRSLYLQN